MSYSVPSSVDETDLKQKEPPRETRSTSGERTGELTVGPVVQPHELVCRFAEKTRECD